MSRMHGYISVYMFCMCICTQFQCVLECTVVTSQQLCAAFEMSHTDRVLLKYITTLRQTCFAISDVCFGASNIGGAFIRTLSGSHLITTFMLVFAGEGSLLEMQCCSKHCCR